MKYIKQTVLATLITSSFLASSVMAANVAGNFQATSTLNAVCVVSANNINFGEIGKVQKDVEGAVIVLCGRDTPYNLSITGGVNGSIGARKMAGALPGNTDKLDYQIYGNVGRTNIWGAVYQTPGNAYGFRADGTSQTNILYARYLGQASLPTPDTYSDTLTVNIDY